MQPIATYVDRLGARHLGIGREFRTAFERGGSAHPVGQIVPLTADTRALEEAVARWLDCYGMILGDAPYARGSGALRNALSIIASTPAPATWTEHDRRRQDRIMKLARAYLYALPGYRPPDLARG